MMRGALALDAGAPQLPTRHALAKVDLATTAWSKVGDRVILLDIANDRYFCFDEPGNRRLIAELEANGGEEWFQPDSLPRPSNWREPVRTCPDIEAGRFRLSEVARALWLQRRIEARLSSASFASILGDLHAALETRSGRSGKITNAGRACIRGFEHARLVRTAADQCLPRSVALSLGLAARGIHTRLVIGVKTAPFAAHCWVQHGGDVLSDSVEEVRRYHPILIL